jgi:hypothetical protein
MDGVYQNCYVSSCHSFTAFTFLRSWRVRQRAATPEYNLYAHQLLGHRPTPLRCSRRGNQSPPLVAGPVAAATAGDRGLCGVTHRQPKTVAETWENGLGRGWAVSGQGPSGLLATSSQCICPCWEIFLYLFYHDFAKLYGPSQILQKYTSGVVAHGVRDITLWAAALGAASSGPWAWPRPSVVGRGVRGLTPITPKFSRKCHNNAKKRKERGRGKGVREEVVKVRSSAGFSSR